LLLSNPTRNPVCWFAWPSVDDGAVHLTPWHDGALRLGVGTTIAKEANHELVWKIGKGFPSKDLELSLEATLTFDTTQPSVLDEDGFCQGANCFAEVAFCLPNRSLSGITCDLATAKASGSPRWGVGEGKGRGTAGAWE
jgi:hypothetical protein